MRHFYASHHSRLRGFVSRRMASRSADAEDVCQEIWLVFFVKYDTHVENYDDPVKVLFPIARCRLAEYWQKHSKSREAPVEGDDLTLLADAWTAAQRDAGEAACLRMDVMEALAALTPRQREALHLHYLDGLKVDETAPLMGISENTVKKLLKTARNRLRGSVRLGSYQTVPRPEEVDE
ncbi:RNA polymerase sigma factor [Streptomyces sp. H39-S7]|uniref:RNA polymerase sigma factor n=1 Tax=Streptomyces sp. H39-S7 TaxID=3004357 RepID=UPI0022AF920D|nr:RNA polymerase sigma factor [Streptomyces sp. H39-S7]MCZ4120198.1 RNA polymerase sigma factor [Streptomyces sp. H39-S7]